MLGIFCRTLRMFALIVLIPALTTGGAAFAQTAAGQQPVSITITPQQAQPGQAIRICVRAYRPGFVSVWNIGPSGRASRLLPAESGHIAQSVQPGTELCTPDGLVASPPAGLEHIEAVWTLTAQAQPPVATFPDTASYGARLASHPPGHVWRAAGQLMVLPPGQALAETNANAGPAPMPGVGQAGSFMITPPTPVAGQTFRICFAAARSGYASLWNLGGSGEVLRLWPTGSHHGAAAPVTAGQQVCVGDPAAGYAVAAPPHPGREGLRLLVSASPDAHPQASGFTSIAQFEAALSRGLSMGALAVADHALVIAAASSAPPIAPPMAASAGQVGATVPTGDTLLARDVPADRLGPMARAALSAARTDAAVTAARVAHGPTGAEAARLLSGGATRDVGGLGLTLMPGVSVALQGAASATRGDGLLAPNGANAGGALHPYVDGSLVGEKGEGLLMAGARGLAGSVRKDGRVYSVFPLGDGAHLIRQIDPNRLPPEHPAGAYEAASARAMTRGPATGLADYSRSAGTATIDIMVVYSNTVAEKQRPIDDAVRLWTMETTIAALQSKIPVTFRLVELLRLDMDEGEMEKDLEALIDPDDGRWDDVARMRNFSKADLVVAVGEYDRACGLAGGILPGPERAFAVVSYPCAEAMYTFSHEIGHLLGARHDLERDPSTFPFAHGHGFIAHDRSFRTLMSYPCGDGCDRIKAWSTPAVKKDDIVIGDEKTAFNAQAVGLAAWRVMNYR